MKISVILPVKDPQITLLEKALKSVYDQTYTDYEILLVNDGSDEAHSKELRSIAEKNPSIHLLEIEPSGVSAARNYAAVQAKGDVLTYLDSDDFLSPVCFEEAVKVLENTDIDAVWGGTVYGTQEELNERKMSAKKQAFCMGELQSRLILLDEGKKHLSKAECIGEPYRFEDGTYINRGIAGRFIRKEKMAGIEFPVGIKFYEDAIWNLIMLDRLKIAYLDSEWYYYMENEKSVSNSYNPEIVSDLEIPLAIIRECIDMDNAEEYTGYTRILMDSFRYISKCLYCNPKWNPSSKEKKKLKAHIYQDFPWKEIGTEKYKAHAQERDCKKAIFYKKRLLLLIWKYRWK
ncbi:MAG: glycosyltransferase [Lachnospiraceae bacterium]|nr:glycosyltransferase [Lachnospiraceae bacterium]